MSEKTAIEWCDATFNPWIGCTKISPACDDCYAARSTPARAMGIAWGPGEPRRRTAESTWAAPKRWAKAAAKAGHRPRVFCASLADWLDNEVPIAWLLEMLDLIRCTPELDWLLLSKRIGNWPRRLSDAWDEGMHPVRVTEDRVALLQWIEDWLADKPPANVWLGATVATQEEADRDVPKLLAVPARVRFLSIEPMLGPIDLTNIRVPLAGESYTEGNVLVHKSCLDRGAPRPAIDWVICGGESGPKARPLHVEWMHSLVAQCASAGVAVNVKQLGRKVHSGGTTRPGEHWPQGSPGEWDGQRFVQTLAHPKGGDPSEWPEGLRRQEFPA